MEYGCVRERPRSEHGNTHKQTLNRNRALRRTGEPCYPPPAGQMIKGQGVSGRGSRHPRA